MAPCHKPEAFLLSSPVSELDFGALSFFRSWTLLFNLQKVFQHSAPVSTAVLTASLCFQQGKIRWLLDAVTDAAQTGITTTGHRTQKSFKGAKKITAARNLCPWGEVIHIVEIKADSMEACGRLRKFAVHLKENFSPTDWDEVHVISSSLF